MWPRLQNQPVQILYWLVNQFVPRGNLATDPVRETRSWYNLIGEVVQSLYGLLFEHRALRFLSSQSTVVYIHMGSTERSVQII